MRHKGVRASRRELALAQDQESHTDSLDPASDDEEPSGRIFAPRIKVLVLVTHPQAASSRVLLTE
jgi:hypothetical protein